MMKIYMMPDGIKRQYEEGKAPAGAVLVEVKKPAAKVEEKAVEPETMQNKAVEGMNKAKRGRKK